MHQEVAVKHGIPYLEKSLMRTGTIVVTAVCSLTLAGTKEIPAAACVPFAASHAPAHLDHLLPES